jgi:hypothetical protein
MGNEAKKLYLDPTHPIGVMRNMSESSYDARTILLLPVPSSLFRELFLGRRARNKSDH